MSLARTPEGHTEAANAAVAKVIRDHRDDTRFSLAQLAAAVDRSPPLVEGWSRGTKSAPAFLLVHPLVPVALRDRLRALTVRAERVSVPIERTSSLLVSAAASAIGVIAEALADNKMTAEERVACAPAIRALRDRCDKWLSTEGIEG